jgi:hypothetical protein
MKCINDQCSQCNDRHSNSLSITLTITVDWGRSGNVTFIDDICEDITLKMDEFENENYDGSLNTMYLFLGTHYNSNSFQNTTVKFDKVSIWPYADVVIEQPKLSKLSRASDKLVMLSASPIGVNGIYNVSMSLNGQQSVTFQDNTQTLTVGDPKSMKVSISESFLFPNDDNIGFLSEFVVGAISGGEIMKFGGTQFADTVLGCKVRFRNTLGTKYADCIVNDDGTNASVTIPSFESEVIVLNSKLEQGDPDLLNTSLAISFNDKQYTQLNHDYSFYYSRPSSCPVIHEDFDYINNAADSS